ncbi:hypothetical protein CEXT_235581 [Caerostris extrusa]|uniref:Uncharacterized protein n=1 Tax=Caerostris extrusa TaxID=172846 RepID=A0AAV4UJY8_CAEEX|nr:hypothetical protein CEXT_235581 [Caerostris extrusa]
MPGVRRQLEEIKEFLLEEIRDIPNFTLYRNDRINTTTLRAGGRDNNHRIIAPTSATRIDCRTNAHNIIDFATFKNISFPATATVFHELSSDHLPCLLDINTNVKSQTKPNLFITNWDNYNFYLQQTNLKLINIDNEEDADTAIENFTNDLYAALNKSSKPKYLTNKGRLPKEIKLMIKNKNYLRRLYQRSRDQTVKNAYKN